MPEFQFARTAAIACALLVPLCSGAAAATEFLCQVTASDKVELGSQVPGIIERVFVERGDKVEAGQPVAQLRADLERVAVEMAKLRAGSDAAIRARRAKLAFVTRKLERNVQLAESHVVSANDLDSMRTDRDIAEQELNAAIEGKKEAEVELRKAQVELEMRTIRSPFSGIVTDRKLTAGAMVRDQPIMVIQRIDPLYVEVTVPVSLMREIKPDTHVQISFVAPGIPPVEETVSLTDKVIDPASDTFGARIVLPNPEGTIPSGTKCRISFPSLGG